MIAQERPIASRRLATGFVLLMALALLPQRAPAAENASAVVRGFYASLLMTMKNAERLGVHGRYAVLAPKVTAAFDIPFMTRLTVGPAWGSLGESERARAQAAFARYVAATYAAEFDGYAGEKLQVLDERPFPYGVLVRSQIVKATGEPVSIDYLLRRHGEGWQIADVYLDGTISELATRRSDFAAILKQGGIDGLIAALEAKAASLSSAKTS
ncbi:MAG TPA: ABC transporter substrate-binding protein [Stellaceae bacterium]|nr:ABC transporter substrate-binding protein [Stellaceae bacterium]